MNPTLNSSLTAHKQTISNFIRPPVLAIKSVDAQLRVGGPATSVNSWIPETIEFCKKTNTPLDFVSTHHYPTDDPLWKKKRSFNGRIFLPISRMNLAPTNAVFYTR